MHYHGHIWAAFQIECNHFALRCLHEFNCVKLPLSWYQYSVTRLHKNFLLSWVDQEVCFLLTPKMPVITDRELGNLGRMWGLDKLTLNVLTSLGMQSFYRSILWLCSNFPIRGFHFDIGLQDQIFKLSPSNWMN